MAHLRTFKINDVNNSGEHTLNQKRMTIYNNTKDIITNFSNSNNCTVKISKKNVKYLPPVNVTNGSCLSSSKNYELLLDVTKGKFLNQYSCRQDISLSYSTTGNINDSNLLLVESNNNVKIYSSRVNNPSNNIIDIDYQTTTSDIIYKTPGLQIVQDYSYNCDESFFNMDKMLENIDNSLNQLSIDYYNKLARQDKLYGFKYPMIFKI